MTVRAKSFEFYEVFGCDYINFLLHAAYEDKIIVLMGTCRIVQSEYLADFVEFGGG